MSFFLLAWFHFIPSPEVLSLLESSNLAGMRLLGALVLGGYNSLNFLEGVAYAGSSWVSSCAAINDISLKIFRKYYSVWLSNIFDLCCACLLISLWNPFLSLSCISIFHTEDSNIESWSDLIITFHDLKKICLSYIIVTGCWVLVAKRKKFFFLVSLSLISLTVCAQFLWIDSISVFVTFLCVCILLGRCTPTVLVPFFCIVD